MRLLSFGNLVLDHNGEQHSSPYIALLALCYVAIEKEKNHRELAFMLQADDAGKEVKVLRNGEGFREQEIESKALRNYRKNISVLEKKIASTLFDEDEFHRDIISNKEFSSDVTDFIALTESSEEADFEKAVALYERGKFLDDFEATYNKGKLKRHYNKAIELQNWIEQQRTEFFARYTAVKEKLGQGVITLDELKRLLPMDVDIDNMGAQKITSFANRQFLEKDEQACKEYVRDYLKQHLEKISDEGIIQDYIFKVLLALEVAPAPNTELVQKAFSLNNRDYDAILEELQLDDWLNIQEQDASQLSESETISLRYDRSLLRNILRRDYNTYLEICLRLLEHANTAQQYDLLKDFLAAHPTAKLDDLEQKLNPIGCQLIHKLINEQKVDEAIDMAETLIHSFEELKTDYPHELGFWYAYALERNREHSKANELLKDLLKWVDSEDEEELYDKLAALRASVLTRVGKTKRDISKAKSLAEDVLQGDCDWALAEANNALGRTSFNLDEDLFRTKSHFNRSALLWESLGETLRQLGALNNLASIIDRNGLVEEAEASYQNVFDLAFEKEVESDFWLGILQNRTMFYHDTVTQGSAPNESLYTQKALEGIKELKRAIEVEDVSPFTKTTVYQNIAVYYEDLAEQDSAIEYYEKALIVAREDKLIQQEGLGLVWIGLLTDNFDKIELGINFLKKGGFEEDAQHSTNEYIEKLNSMLANKALTEKTRDEINYRLSHLSE